MNGINSRNATRTSSSSSVSKTASSGSTEKSPPTAGQKSILQAAKDIFSSIMKALSGGSGKSEVSKKSVSESGSLAKAGGSKGKNINEKTDDEISSVLNNPATKYDKSLSQTNTGGLVKEFSSTLVNRGDGGEDGKIECNKGRITDQMDIAQHTGDAYGTATISSMMTDTIMASATKGSEASTKIDGFVENGIKSFGSIQDEVKASLLKDATPAESTALDKLFSKDAPTSFSAATESMSPSEKSNLYNSITTMSRGIQMVTDLKSQGKTIILRDGLLNGNKADSSVDKNEKKMIADEQKFSAFMQETGNKALGVTYSYRSTNVQMGNLQISSTKQKADESEIKSLQNVLTSAIKNQDSPEYKAADAALKALNKGDSTPAERLQLLFTFDRAIDKATTPVDGKSSTAKVKHCKSGKDRTGSVAQYNSITNAGLDKMGAAADKTFFSMAEAESHFKSTGQESTFKEIKDDMNQDLYKANKFNATEHCARVMEEDPGHGKAKLGEMDTGVQQLVLGDTGFSNIGAESKTFTGTPVIGYGFKAKAAIRGMFGG